MKAFVRKARFVLMTVGLIMMLMTGTVYGETLRILTWETYKSSEHQQKFVNLIKEKYGIDLKLDVSCVNSNDEFFPGLRDRKADIIAPSHPVPKDKRFHLIDLNLLLPVNLDNIPNYKNIIPGLQKAEYCTENNEIYGVPVARGPYGLAYNTEIIKEEPTTWNILWDPKYKDKYTLGKYQYQQNVNITALAMGIPPEDISDYAKLNRPDFQKKLAQLAVNAHSMWEGEDRAEDLKGLSLAVVWGTALPELKKMGEVWKMAEPREGTTAWVDNFMISHTLKDNPKMKRIAEEWLNYVLSDDFQAYLLQVFALHPITTSVKAKLTPEEIEQFHLDDPAYFEKNRILWTTLDKKNRKGLERLWNKAMKKRKE